MNFTEALTFDTEQARTDVEANEQNELCDSTYPMTAYEVIDLLHIEIRRLRKVEAMGIGMGMLLSDSGIHPRSIQ